MKMNIKRKMKKKYKQYENIIQMIQSPFSKDNELP